MLLQQISLVSVHSISKCSTLLHGGDLKGSKNSYILEH